MAEDLIIAIPVYDGVDLVDVSGPYEIFGWMAEQWRDRNTHVYLVAHSADPVTTRDRFTFLPQKTFDEVPHAHVLWIPGGDPQALVRQMKDRAYIEFIQSRSKSAEYVASVCEGALIAAHAGLFDGYKVTTHWAFIECLKRYPVTVVDGYPRYWHDRNRITGGGISSSLDEALYLVKVIAGEPVAERVQRILQYYPDPPVSSQLPDQPPPCPLGDQIPIPQTS